MSIHQLQRIVISGPLLGTFLDILHLVHLGDRLYGWGKQYLERKMDDYLRFCLKHELISSELKNGEELLDCERLWFIFDGDALAVRQAGSGLQVIHTPRHTAITLQIRTIGSLGQYLGYECILAELETGQKVAPEISFVPLRALLGKIDGDHFIIAGRGLQMLRFHVEHKYCGFCGKETAGSRGEFSRICTSCGHTSFPRVSPAVIMSVTDKEKILLGRSPHFPTGMYSTLAGFVEPGETLEEAVMREVFEEVAITVSDILYRGSQPWPFPHSMMIGFSTHYHSGTIRVDSRELEDARWFTADNLPKLPRRGTIARHLIDTFLNTL